MIKKTKRQKNILWFDKILNSRNGQNKEADMSLNFNSFSIIGGGCWGSALGVLLYKKKYKIKIWEYSKKTIEIIKKTQENKKHLEGFKLPKDLYFTNDLEEALYKTDAVIFAIPASVLLSVIKQIKKFFKNKLPIISGIKGLVCGLKRPSEIMENELGADVFVLSGPSHAEEVIYSKPTAVVLAAKNKKIGINLQRALSSDEFRVYLNDDVVGVEFAGALKNVIAIASGIADGLGLGDNTKGALLTRGMVEIARFGMLFGAKKETFFGLAGVGDLIATSISRHSRNRSLGEFLAKGLNLDEALKLVKTTAEGVNTTKVIIESIKGKNIQMPITAQVYSILFEKKSPKEAVLSLMRRELKEEVI